MGKPENQTKNTLICFSHFLSLSFYDKPTHNPYKNKNKYWADEMKNFLVPSYVTIFSISLAHKLYAISLSISRSVSGIWSIEWNNYKEFVMGYLGLVWIKKKVTRHSVFITHHSSLSFYHSSLITHHLKHPILFGTITHLSSLNIFQLFVDPIHVPCSTFTLFIYFFPSTFSTQTHWTSKKNKEDLKTESVKRKKKKKKKEKKKKPRNPKEKKKKKKIRNNKPSNPKEGKKKKKKKKRRKNWRLNQCWWDNALDEGPTDAVYLWKCHWIMDDQIWKQLKSVFFF